jgi:3-methyladenine DNA glycosylase/8-oxoguanine DNA glycosylase
VGRGTAVLEVEVRPPWPYRLPLRNGGDGVQRRRGGVITRLLHVETDPVIVHVWESGDRVAFRAAHAGRCESRQALEVAIERMRFATGVDEDLSEFYDAFRVDPLVGPAVRRAPWRRTRRKPWPWEALAWAITEQLIQVSRAAAIQRRIVRRWGPSLEPAKGGDAAWRGPGPLRDVPTPQVIRGRAPAELCSMDLSNARAIAMIRCAREVAAGRADLSSASADRRLLEIPEIGPWTVQSLGLFGRGEPDALPAGDLAYVKLVGYLTGLGRRATVEEVEEYFEPYRPFRGLAASFAAGHWGRAMGAGPPAALAA